MTSDWKECKIEDLNIQIIDGDRGENYPNRQELLNSGDCLFLSTQNVTKKGFDFSETKWITKEKDNLLRNGKLSYGDIVITTRGTVGNIALYSNDIKYTDVRINSGMLIVRCRETIYNKYLYYILSSNFFTKKILSIQSGTAQPQLPKSHFKKMSIPLPPLDTQRKIAKVLSTIDDKIELNNKINENLEQQAQAIFKSWFVDFEPFGGVMPEEWSDGNLCDITNICSGKRPLQKENWKTTEFCIPIIGASSIMGYTNKYLYDNKILITGRVGTLGIIQKVSSSCWASDNTLVITSKYYEFTYQVLKTINYNNLNRGSTQPLITQTDLKNIKIIIPKTDILNQFEVKLDGLMQLQQNLLKENEGLTQLRDTLLPKLMSGEIDVSNVEIAGIY